MGKPVAKVRTAVNEITSTVLIGIGLIAVNVISWRFHGRIDMTADHEFTLSQASRDVVSHLPDRVTIKAFISKDLQPEYQQVAQFTRDLLDEYASASKGKLVWSAVDPMGDKELEKEAQKLRIARKPRGKASSTKFSLDLSYLGLAIEYGGNSEPIPDIQSPNGLEYQVTTLVKILTQKKKKIAFAVSEGELSPMQDPQHQQPAGVANLRGFLREYDIVPQPINGPAIPDDVDALIIAGPKAPLNDRAKYNVDQFLMRGKPVAFLIDGMIIETPRQPMPGMETNQPRIGRRVDTGLDDMLEHYGFRVRDDIISEPVQNVVGPVQVQGRLIGINWPAFAAMTRLGDHQITKAIRAAVLPFASSLELVKDKQPGLKVTELMSTTPDAWRNASFYIFDPTVREIKPGEDKGPFPMAYAAEGKLTSFYAGKPHAGEKGDKVAPPDPNSSTPPGTEVSINEQANAKLVLVGNSQMISDEYTSLIGQGLQVYGQNVLFLMSTLSWFTGDAASRELASKTLAGRPLAPTSDAKASAVKWGTLICTPLLFILYGIVRWQLRRGRRRSVTL
jgi:ABC-type uncharacterized transport system involved in gliding motility auxiliary subunit